MQVWQAALLGAIQGLAEFLPISSSGHLVLVQNLLGIEGDMLLFDTMLHVGTLAAVFVVLWKDIWALLRRPFVPLMGYMVLSTLPLVLLTLLVGDWVESLFGGSLLGVGFLLTSVLLFARTRMPQGDIEADRMGTRRALVVGLGQLVALLPGVSRSGSTLVAGRLAGLKAADCPRYSFLLSIPAILGSVVYQGKDLLTGGFEAIGPASVLVGTLVAAITGYFAMRALLALLQKQKVWLFGVYTAVLGAAVLVDQLALHLVF